MHNKRNTKTQILGCQWAEPGEGKGYSTGPAVENTLLFVLMIKGAEVGQKITPERPKTDER